MDMTSPEIWAQICAQADKNGIALPSRPPRPQDIITRNNPNLPFKQTLLLGSFVVALTPSNDNTTREQLINQFAKQALQGSGINVPIVHRVFQLPKPYGQFVSIRQNLPGISLDHWCRNKNVNPLSKLDTLAPQLGKMLGHLHRCVINRSKLPYRKTHETFLLTPEKISDLTRLLETKGCNDNTVRLYQKASECFRLQNKSEAPEPLCFSHGDPHVGNILVHPEGNTITGLFDFEFATYNDRRSDISQIAYFTPNASILFAKTYNQETKEELPPLSPLDVSQTQLHQYLMEDSFDGTQHGQFLDMLLRNFLTLAKLVADQHEVTAPRAFQRPSATPWTY